MDKKAEEYGKEVSARYGAFTRSELDQLLLDWTKAIEVVATNAFRAGMAYGAANEGRITSPDPEGTPV